MDNKFLKYWFKGFESSLEEIDIQNREVIFKECGKSCSDSYTRQIYLDVYKRSESIVDFLKNLKKQFSEMDIQVIGENVIEIEYKYCACDLVKSGYIHTPLLCECSRQSLLYNWESIFGTNKIQIELLQSILGGSSSCRFRINILE